MEEESIENKQQFLTDEIIGKNYDQTRFVNFCLSKKENGDDLTIWTMDELKQLVHEFQEKEGGVQPQLPQQEEENLVDDEQPQGPSQSVAEKMDGESLNAQNEPQNNNEVHQESQPPSSEENKSTEKPEPVEKEEKGEVILEVQCKILEKTNLNDRPIKVTIQNPTEVGSGVLSSKYVKYEVSTDVPENWLVGRRYNDFIWLRQVLIKFNPGQVIPPLPNKKIGKKRFEEKFIKKRMGYLQKFIDNVMANEFFKASPPLIPFLSFSDRAKFESKMKELTSFIPSPYVEEFKTFSGTVHIAKEQQDNEKYFGKIQSYFQNQDILCDRLRQNMKRFNNGMKECIKAIDDLQKDFETFFILNDRVMMKKPITKSYEQISMFLKSYKDIFSKQNDILKKHFKDFFKFVQMEGTSYHELIINRESIKNVYMNERNKLNAKKEKLWQGRGGDLAKWELGDDSFKLDREKLTQDKDYAFKHMCARETEKVDSMMKQFGYVNRMNFEELKKMIDINCERYVENIKGFCDDFYATLEDSRSICNGMKQVITNIDVEVLK